MALCRNGHNIRYSMLQTMALGIGGHNIRYGIMQTDFNTSGIKFLNRKFEYFCLKESIYIQNESICQIVEKSVRAGIMYDQRTLGRILPTWGIEFSVS